MKQIVKGEEPVFLSAFKRGESPGWIPSFAAMKDDKEIQRKLKEVLLLEQGYLCCYCCQRIEAISSHFEHFLSQAEFPELDLDYRNLLASCTTEGQERHCGAKKQSQRIETSPLDRDCEEFFFFDLEGRILASAGSARHSIEVLGLDRPLLRESRRQAIRVFTENIDELSDHELEMLVKGLGERDKQGKFQAFQPAVVQVLVRSFLGPQKSGPQGSVVAHDFD